MEVDGQEGRKVAFAQALACLAIVICALEGVYLPQNHDKRENDGGQQATY